MTPLLTFAAVLIAACIVIAIVWTLLGAIPNLPPVVRTVAVLLLALVGVIFLAGMLPGFGEWRGRAC